MNRFVTWLSAAAALALAASPLAAQTDTTFTYQGELKENGGLANGAFNNASSSSRKASNPASLVIFVP